jgi:hypothetical protein
MGLSGGGVEMGLVHGMVLRDGNETGCSAVWPEVE